MLRVDSYPIVVRTAFLVTLAGVLLLSLTPERQELGFTFFHHDNDKLNHVAAFAVLAALGSLGWPQHKAKLIVFLAFTGAAIEVLQGVQQIGRDPEVFDWLADCAGMACGLTIVGWAKKMAP